MFLLWQKRKNHLFLVPFRPAAPGFLVGNRLSDESGVSPLAIANVAVSNVREACLRLFFDDREAATTSSASDLTGAESATREAEDLEARLLGGAAAGEAEDLVLRLLGMAEAEEESGAASAKIN